MIPYVSTALEASAVIAASKKTLYSLLITNKGPDQDYMIFNAAAVPANGAVTPKFYVTLPANTSFMLDLNGVEFLTGICVCNSTSGSPTTKTLGAADSFFTADYQ